jgi:hypothetical protein
MNWRREFKYLAPMEALPDLRRDLLPFVELDPFLAGRGGLHYTVRSIYCDTRNFDFYRVKVDGANLRLKLRIRGYDSCEADTTVFLEIRRKRGDFVSKDRAPIRRKDLGDFLVDPDIPLHIIDAHGTGDAEAAARRFLYHYRRRALSPTALVVYDREAFVGKFDSRLRITFDKNLRGSLFPSQDGLNDDSRLCPAMRRHFVLEVKFYEGLPGWVRSWITRHGLRRMALSKYNMCLDLHGVDSPSLLKPARAGAFSPPTDRTEPAPATRDLPDPELIHAGAI